MINVQEIRRNVINVVKNYSDAQVKVRKATSNEPWGASSTLMGEIADLTYNVVAFSEIMQIIWKRLNDHGKNWRHVYKALVLLEYLIKTGSEKVAQQCRDNLFAIQTLKDFQYLEDNKDQGLSIREKSKALVTLLKDDERLKNERARALKAKERFAQSHSVVASSVLEAGESIPKTSSSYHESLSSPIEGLGSSSRAPNSELECARPQTVGEEELQLQLALAMSKEEAEQEERQRKNDDLRLKLALEESEKLKKVAQPRSAVDDLLSLNEPTVPVMTDPWGAPLQENNLLPSPPNKSKPQQQQQDPWGGSASALTSSSFEPEKSAFPDPWVSQPRSTSAVNDPWSLGSNDSGQPSKNDPWNTANSNGNVNHEIRLTDLMEPSKVLNNSDSVRRTPESFLGPNSNLVNLDALVSNKTQSSTSPNNNPFASAVVPAPSNPFQTNKPSQPTINQLRAQSSSTTVNYSNASALSSLFTTSTDPSLMPAMSNNTGSTMPMMPTTTLASPWASFPSSQVGPNVSSNSATSPQNNPFAM
ncbi:hypothetical protein RDWZM_007992 [Blomia tropicalis]|uniref:ENTH domain-containing protein n=1 Tax=Blomia tropicalis TaxID=40697 RepID=A0A9Q0RJY2_BLOTA|nr:hypothetical protein RDWZM_007992 [Blomia tropicalis]